MTNDLIIDVASLFFLGFRITRGKIKLVTIYLKFLFKTTKKKNVSKVFTNDYKHVNRTNRNLKSESTLTVRWLNYMSFIPGRGKGILKYLTTSIPNK